MTALHWWCVEWHDQPNRAMRSDWFLAETVETAIMEAASVPRYGCVEFRASGHPPISNESEAGRKLWVQRNHGSPTKGTDRSVGQR